MSSPVNKLETPSITPPAPFTNAPGIPGRKLPTPLIILPADSAFSAVGVSDASQSEVQF